METVSFIIDILIVVLGVAFIIFIHELGHFSVAKWLKMKVEAFSIGFGKVLWSFQKGETEYRLSLIPLGGYVKLSGETSDQSTGDDRDFFKRPASHRALVLVAGVVMNAVSAVFMIIGAYLVGVKEVKPEVGAVIDESPAAIELGLQTGDVISQINDVTIYDFTEIRQEIALSGGEPLTVSWQRGDQTFQKTVDPKYDDDIGLYTLGLNPRPLAVIKDLQAPMADAGVKVWDTITDVKVNGLWQSITYYDEFEKYFNEVENQPIDLRVRRRDQSTFETTLEPTILMGFVYQEPETTWYDDFLKPLEIQDTPMPLTVGAVIPGYPAEEIGLQAGDVIESAVVAGTVTQFRGLSNPLSSFQDYLRKNSEQEITLHWQSAQGPKSASFKPKKRLSAGFLPMNNFQTTQLSLATPGALLDRAFRKSRNDFLVVLRSLKSFVTGSVDVKNMGGPITIARASFLFLELGLGSYLAFLAMISFNLAILNILPIPLLDGGHLLMVGIEKLIGRQVNEKVQIAFQYVGILILGSLMLFVFYNDIFNVQW